jgi:hypothetical protein
MAGPKQGREANASASIALAAFVFLALAVGVFFLVKGLCPADLPTETNSDFVDSVFHNRGVVLAARLLLVLGAIVLVAGGVFVVGSIASRMKKGDWLRKAGPFEVSEDAIGDVEDQIDRWRLAAAAGQEEVAELTERLKDSDDLIQHLRVELDRTHRSQ